MSQTARQPDRPVVGVLVFKAEVTEQDASDLLFMASVYCESTDIRQS